jgi:pyoverdine/dityrosine biosynthesis protein Dit1
MKIKAILIDVEAQELRYVEVNKDNGSALKSMYKHIGCDLVDVINIDEQNDLFVDEEGLLKLDENSKFFLFDGFPQPLAGNGLILGLDAEEGDTIATTLTLEEIAEKVLFTDIHTLRSVYS